MGNTNTIVFNKAVIYVVMANYITVERKDCACKCTITGVAPAKTGL